MRPKRQGVDRARRRANQLTSVAILVIVLGLGLMSLGPLENYSLAADRTDALQADHEALAAQVQTLQEERAALLTDEEMELLARSEHGMVRPGEIPFVVLTPSAAPSMPPPVGNRHGPDPDAPWYRQLGRRIAELFG